MAKRTLQINEKDGTMMEHVDNVTAGAVEKNSTVIKDNDRKTNKAIASDLYKHMNKIHERLDELEDLVKLGFKKQNSAADVLTALQQRMDGKDPEFEKKVKLGNEKIPELNESQTATYGHLAPAGILEVVHAVLGVDFGGFMKADSGTPRTLFTLLVPERLTGARNDFRSVTVDNISAEADAKKWCEKVKSNIFKHYTVKKSGNPEFLVYRT